MAAGNQVTHSSGPKRGRDLAGDGGRKVARGQGRDLPGLHGFP